MLLLLLGLVFAKSRGKRKTAEFDDHLGRLAEQGEDRLAEPVDSHFRHRPHARAADVARRFPTTSSSRNRARIARCRRRRTFRSRPTVRTDETISSETAVNLDQGDPLAEADFHMAYGLYDQAADLVRIAIQREPHRRDLKLKLLEVFFVWGNKEQFLTMARELSE